MKNRILGYVRVSTQEQDVETQKNKIREYCENHRIMIDEWIEIEISSRKSTEARKIDELLAKLNQGDTVIVYELSRLCRSMHEMLNIVNEIVDVKKVRLTSVTQDKT